MSKNTKNQLKKSLLSSQSSSTNPFDFEDDEDDNNTNVTASSINANPLCVDDPIQSNPNNPNLTTNKINSKLSSFGHGSTLSAFSPNKTNVTATQTSLGFDDTVSPLHTARSNSSSNYNTSSNRNISTSDSRTTISASTNTRRSGKETSTNPFNEDLDELVDSNQSTINHNGAHATISTNSSRSISKNNSIDTFLEHSNSNNNRDATAASANVMSRLNKKQSLERNDSNPDVGSSALPPNMKLQTSMNYFYNLRRSFEASNDKVGHDDELVSAYDTLDPIVAASRDSQSRDATTTERLQSVYHHNSLSVIWLFLAVLLHCIIWGILLTVTNQVIPKAVTVFISLCMVLVTLLIIFIRFLVKKKSTKTRITHYGDGNVRVELSPEDETDGMSDLSIKLLALIAILEGGMFAVYTAATADSDAQSYNAGGFVTKGTVIQTLNFASILFLAVHRIVRPANRADPMRTLLELEVVSVCWDALDGSTLYQLLDSLNLNPGFGFSIRVLMAFWYMSVGVRIALMFLTHLPPDAKLYSWVLNQPYFYSENPTVDRSLSALKLRCKIILVMAAAEFYAMAVRIHIWTLGLLSPLQQEMLLKNVLFLSTCYSAYSMYQSTVHRQWNSRELAFGFKIPTRRTQLQIYRYAFCILFICQSAILSSILVKAEGESEGGGGLWGLNVFSDLVLVFFFFFYCRNAYRQNSQRLSGFWLWPQDSFVLFPGRLGMVTSFLMMLSMYAFRLPGLYMSFDRLTALHAADPSSGLTYNGAMFVIQISTVTIACNALFWSVACLLFHADFTVCPDNYHAIHDPIINMVATATMTEGALDVLSATALLALAELNTLPTSVGWVVAISSVFEMMNACQCFGLQAMLSGGKNDSPLDLVKWKAYLRASRFLIDLFVFILRIVLWIQYDAVSSVFLIKNLYNLIHTVAQVERYFGGRNYAPATLFTSEVRPEEWYGMSSDEWRRATSSIQF